MTEVGFEWVQKTTSGVKQAFRRGRTTINLSVTDPFVLSTRTSQGTRPIWNGVDNPINNVGTIQTIPRTTVGSVVQVAGTPGNPTIIRDKKIPFRLLITASYQKFINCEFTYSYTGAIAGAGGGMVDNQTGDYVGLEFERCNFIPEGTLGKVYNGYYGAHAKFTRCAFAKCIDGIGVYNRKEGLSNIDMISNWLGYFCWWNDDAPAHNDGTHNDGIQHGTGHYSNVYGNFFQGIKYNGANPANVTLTGDGSTYSIATGNGVDVLFEKGKNGASADADWTDNKMPQQGQQYLIQHAAYFLSGDFNINNNWFWNGHVGVKASGAATSSANGGTSGQRLMDNVELKNNLFGGRWWHDSSTLPMSPIRYDTNVVLNGVRRTIASKATIADTNGNYVDSGVELAYETSYGPGGAIAGNPIRHFVDLAPSQAVN